MKMIGEKEAEIQNALDRGHGQGDILDREVDRIETITAVAAAASTTT
jgi:hypothetical protein